MTDTTAPFPIIVLSGPKGGVGRIFNVTKTPHGLFDIWEEGNSHFSDTLTAQELAELGKELIALSKS